MIYFLISLFLLVGNVETTPAFYVSSVNAQEAIVATAQSTGSSDDELSEDALADRTNAYKLGYELGRRFGFIIGFLLTLAVAIFVFNRIYRAMKRREKMKREMKELELKAIRSQMNPHFIFNALASIQNLISRPDTARANEYLVNFSRLLRMVMENSGKKLVILSDEIKQLDLYLKLEQLRFPFTFSVIIDSQIDPDQTEIPGMLIQPFVENAVKHANHTLHTKKVCRVF